MRKVTNTVCSSSPSVAMLCFVYIGTKVFWIEGYTLAFSFKSKPIIIEIRMHIQVGSKTGTMEEYCY